METLTMQSNDAKALEAIKAYAQKFDVQVLEDQKGDVESEQKLNGTQVKKLAAQFNLKELAGSLSDLNLDAKELRKQA